LIAHRIPESDLKRSLLAFGLHWLLCLPSEALAHAYGPVTVDHHLRWIMHDKAALTLIGFGAGLAHRLADAPIPS
jgi:hypothetical protein